MNQESREEAHHAWTGVRGSGMCRQRLDGGHWGQVSEESEHKARGSRGWQRSVGEATEAAGAERPTRSQSIGTWCPDQRGSWGLLKRPGGERSARAQLGVRRRQARSPEGTGTSTGGT